MNRNNITIEQINDLINSQDFDKIKAIQKELLYAPIELIHIEERAVLERIEQFIIDKYKIEQLVEEKSLDEKIDGIGVIFFEYKDYKVSAKVNVKITFCQGDYFTPDAGDADVKIVELKIKILEE